MKEPNTAIAKRGQKSVRERLGPAAFFNANEIAAPVVDRSEPLGLGAWSQHCLGHGNCRLALVFFRHSGQIRRHLCLAVLSSFRGS